MISVLKQCVTPQIYTNTSPKSFMMQVKVCIHDMSIKNEKLPISELTSTHNV